MSTFEPTLTRVSLLLYATDAELPPVYDHLQILRGKSASDSPDAVTGPSATSAEIRCTRTGPYQLHDAVLNLLLEDGSEFSYAFTGTDPIDAADAADELNIASALLDCYDDTGVLVLRTLSTGNASFIKVTGGDACWWLGLSNNDVRYGVSANIELVTATHLYAATDGGGSTDWSYWYRFVSTTPAFSTLRQCTTVGRDLVLNIALLSVGTLHAGALTGLADYNNRLHVANRYVPPSISGMLITGDQEARIDPSGEAHVTLIRGSKVEFYIPGSPVHRVITVPDVDTFDMLDPSLAADDPWAIVVPPYTSLPRTTP